MRLNGKRLVFSEHSYDAVATFFILFYFIFYFIVTISSLSFYYFNQSLHSSLECYMNLTCNISRPEKQINYQIL